MENWDKISDRVLSTFWSEIEAKAKYDIGNWAVGFCETYLIVIDENINEKAVESTANFMLTEDANKGIEQPGIQYLDTNSPIVIRITYGCSLK